MMKKIAWLVGMLCFSTLVAQKKIYATVQSLQSDADDAANRFIKTLDSKGNFGTYYMLNEDESTIVGDFPISELRKGQYNEENVIGYVFTYQLKKEYYPVPEGDNLKFTLYINKNLEVDYSERWNSKWSHMVSGNLQVSYDNLPEAKDKEFITAQLNFINSLKEGKVHTASQIKSYLKKKYPNKSFNDISITRQSFPPYKVHFNVTEANCSDCVRLEIPVDSFEGVETSLVTYRAISG